MKKEKINSKESAERMGAYSHGYKVITGDSEFIYTTGQIAMDKDGNVMFPGDIAKQAEYVYQSLEKILNEAGATLDDVVKATTYITNMADFSKISAIRNRYLRNAEPVSTMVEINRTAKEGCLVEIEVMAVKEKAN